MGVCNDLIACVYEKALVAHWESPSIFFILLKGQCVAFCYLLNYLYFFWDFVGCSGLVITAKQAKNK